MITKINIILNNTSIVLAIIIILTIYLTYLSAIQSMDSYNSWINYRSPYIDKLISIKPNVETDLYTGSGIARNIIFILYDGVQPNIFLELSNKSWQVRKLISSGALFINGSTNTPTYSLPGRASILTGSPPEINEVSSNDFQGEIRIDSIVRVAKENGLKITCSGDNSFYRMFLSQIDRCIEIMDGAGHGANALRYGLELFREAMDEGSNIFLWIGISDADLIGHYAGGWSLEYNNTLINIADHTIEFIDKLRELGGLNNTLIIIVNDHGFKKQGHHGGVEKEVRAVFALFIGPGIVRGVYNESFTHNDIAPTVSMLMGWRLPAHSIGLPLTTGFMVSQDLIDLYVSRARNQSLTILSILKTSIIPNSSDPRELYREIVDELYTQGSLWRSIYIAPPILLTVFIAIYMIQIYKRERSLVKPIAILIAIAVFEFSFRITYSVIDGAYSLSDIKSFNDFITQIFISTAIAGLVSGVSIGLVEVTPLRMGLKSFPNNILIIIASIIAIQIYLSAPLYIIYGPTVRFPFPNWNDAVFFFIHLIRGFSTPIIGAPILIATYIILIGVGYLLLNRLRSIKTM